jgi:hypothetical protein
MEMLVESFLTMSENVASRANPFWGEYGFKVRRA